MSRQGLLFLPAVLAVLGLAACAPVLRTSSQSGPAAGPTLAEIGPLAPAWRAEFIPDQYRSGDYVCHTGHGGFDVAGDGTVAGATTTWIGGLSGVFTGQIAPDGSFTGQSTHDGVEISRGEGRLVSAERITGTWEEMHSGCKGTWVAEPLPDPPLSRPAYAAPKACVLSGKPDQQYCDYTLPDGTGRHIALAQDIFDFSTFLRAFGGEPPGYDQPLLAQRAIVAFFDAVNGTIPGATKKVRHFEDARNLPYGALACLHYGYDLVPGAPPENAAPDIGTFVLAAAGRTIRVEGRFCFQPLPRQGSRFVMLEAAEAQGPMPDDARFARDIAKILGSLRLP